MSARHFHFSLIGGVPQDGPRARVETMKIGRTTWIGLTLVVVGWAMLLSETAIADFLTLKDPPMVAPSFHDDFIEVSKTLIFSGFGLALVGALMTGFGALNRFFEAVLLRSGQKSQTLSPTPIQESFHEEVIPAPRIGRPFRTFADGSVEVDTILGNRRFRSMTEARDFI